MSHGKTDMEMKWNILYKRENLNLYILYNKNNLQLTVVEYVPASLYIHSHCSQLC